VPAVIPVKAVKTELDGIQTLPIIGVVSYPTTLPLTGLPLLQALPLHYVT